MQISCIALACTASLTSARALRHGTEYIASVRFITTPRRSRSRAMKLRNCVLQISRPPALRFRMATPKKTSRKPNAAFMKPVQPDDKLAAVVGSAPLPRTELTKKLWAVSYTHLTLPTIYSV